MKTLFKKYLLNKAPFTESELQTLLSAVQVKHYAKGETIFAQGSYWNFNGFVCSGLACTIQEENGLNNVLSFAPEDHWIGDRHSLLTGKAMPSTAVALEATTILLIAEEDFERLRVLIPTFNDMVYALIQNTLLAAQKHIYQDAILSDADRFRNFEAQRPGLAQRLPAPLLASYLKMSIERLRDIMGGNLPSYRLGRGVRVSA